MKKFLIGSISAFLPLMAFAQNAIPQVVTSYSDVQLVLTTVGNWMFGILLSLAVLFLLYAAFTYLRAGGDPSKVDEAKNIIIYAIIAVVVAVLAKGMVMLAQSLIPGAGVTTPGA